MPNFDEYLMRHSESWMLFIVEQIEHVEGIHYRMPVPLEERWDALMQTPHTQSHLVA